MLLTHASRYYWAQIDSSVKQCPRLPSNIICIADLMHRFITSGSRHFTSAVLGRRQISVIMRTQHSSALQIPSDESHIDPFQNGAAEAANDQATTSRGRQHTSNAAQHAAAPSFDLTIASQAVQTQQSNPKRDINTALLGDKAKKQRMQNVAARAGRTLTPRPGKAGASDLGQGSIVYYHPAAFSEEERAQLFNRLKVKRAPYDGHISPQHVLAMMSACLALPDIMCLFGMCILKQFSDVPM